MGTGGRGGMGHEMGRGQGGRTGWGVGTEYTEYIVSTQARSCNEMGFLSFLNHTQQ